MRPARLLFATQEEAGLCSYLHPRLVLPLVSSGLLVAANELSRWKYGRRSRFRATLYIIFSIQYIATPSSFIETGAPDRFPNKREIA